MQYVLGLGILCKKYKKNPNIRVFADNTFIDEFEITHSDETKKFTDISKNCKMTKNWSAKHFHILHIDEKHLNSKISIHVQNDDSNYTNSFMSKSTVIAFDSIFLIPKHFLDNNCKFYSEIYDKDIEKLQKICKTYFDECSKCGLKAILSFDGTQFWQVTTDKKADLPDNI